jgi:hypothetical protein
VKKGYIAYFVEIMASHFDDAFHEEENEAFHEEENEASHLPDKLRDDDIGDFAAASDEVIRFGDQDASSTREQEQHQSGLLEDANCSHDPSDDDDGLYSDGSSNLSHADGEEFDDEEDAVVGRGGPPWKIKHSSGDHKFKGREEILNINGTL